MPSIILLDTEYTAWPGSRENLWRTPGEHREIIQIAAAKCEISEAGLIEEATLNTLVLPHINPELSEYIQNLTGITQADINAYGVDFASAIMLFHQFSDHGTTPVFSWGPDSDVFAENCILTHTLIPPFPAGFWDLRKIMVRRGIAIDGYMSGTLYQKFDLTVPGHIHNALHDVHSLAASIHYLLGRSMLSPPDFFTGE